MAVEKVASIVLCKSFERVFSPVAVHSVKQLKKDAFQLSRVVKARMVRMRRGTSTKSRSSSW